MDPDVFTRLANDLASAAAADCEGFAGVCVHREVRAHAVAAGRDAFVDIAREEHTAGKEGEPRWTLHVHHGSLEAEARADPKLDVEALLRRVVVHGAGRLREYAEAAQVVESEDALFEEHARFLRGMPVTPAWYTRGKRLADGIWAVDLDLFVEVALRESEWRAAGGHRMRLRILGEDLELEIPAKTDLEEAWTLEGAGLFEPAPGVDVEDLDEESAGRTGDLHVLPFAW